MKCYGVTDKGLVRKQNQDNYVIAYNENRDVFAIVCDGIGGGRAGDVASKMAIDYFSQVFSENRGFKDPEDAKTWIRYHITQCNDQIFTKSTTTKIYKGMGTTFVGCLISSVGKFVVNIGDSRAYGINAQGQFNQLTIDHTLVNDMLRHGEITPQEAAVHPRRNVLTNALGVWGNVRVDIDYHQEILYDILLCSDGLYGYIKPEQIVQVMMTDELTNALKARKLLNLALRAGGFDNITIILMELEEGDNR